MLKRTIEFNNLGGDYASLLECVRCKKNAAVFGLPQGAKSFVAAGIAPVLFVAADRLEAERVYRDLDTYADGKAVYLAPKEEVLLATRAISADSLYRRLSALSEIVRGETKFVVTCPEALLQLCPPRDKFERATVTLEKGKEYDIGEIAKGLVRAGYVREDRVAARGQFSMRGDLLDVFPIDAETPIRLDFFGDELESLKQLDPETFKACGELDRLTVIPATDVLFGEDEQDEILEALYHAVPDGLNADAAVAMKALVDDFEIRVRAVDCSQANSFVLPLLKDVGTVFDYVEPHFVILFDEYKRVKDGFSATFTEHNSRLMGLLERGGALKTQAGQLIAPEEFLNRAEVYGKVNLTALSARVEGFLPDAIFNLKISPCANYSLDYQTLASDLRAWLKGGYRAVLCGKDSDSADRIMAELRELDLGVAYAANSDGTKKEILVTPEFLDHGFILHSQKLAVIGTHDLLRRERKRLRSKKRKTDAFVAPEIGDFVVHELHGIGQMKGMTRLTTGGITRDYALIAYAGGDNLYVPAEQMDLLVRFSGTEKQPKLSKIGGKEFARIKERVAKSIREMAIDLRELYAKRERSKGFHFAEDSEFQLEFERDFPFEETEDQLRSIEEIKADMQSNKVMDRLLCGDVGYGKTEVALRAAFKAVENGKQVCFLAPTTVLSQQHFNTCISRFEKFGIRVDFLNRFKSAAAARETLKRLAAGKIDVICGTHRLLSNDVRFSDLGLLILDEEQRFGVEHKEKIKTLKADIDVLSMSATPIPRTLHMSLSGIRDISVIETPPKKRLPVQTYVLELSDGLIHDAAVRELSRGGQMFILYNRVVGIESFAAHVQEIIPEARIIVAHGQMDSDRLEKSIMQFYSGEADILVCSTIVENGIDIPNANTMIVVDSDRLGLSQLYQLRGRVGRSDRLAHVFFTYTENKILTENAYKRLSAVMEFTEFGSGFKIAMRDLEIRGAGNVLGREQHGFMERVGYDMYCKMLKEAVDGESEQTPKHPEPEMDVKWDAYIPDAYIQSPNARVLAYREIAAVRTEEDSLDVLERLEDVYGKVPSVVNTLVNIALIKALAQNFGVLKVVSNERETKLILSVESFQSEALFEAIDRCSSHCKLVAKTVPEVVFTRDYRMTAAEQLLTFFLRPEES